MSICYRGLLYGQTAPPRGASDGGWLSCHRMAHYVLIRCFLQLSLAEALCLCNFFSIGDRPHVIRVAKCKV